MGRSREEIASCRESLLTTLQSLQQEAKQLGGHFELLCSVADGADLLAIEVAKSIEMPVHLNLPLPPEEFKKDYLDASGELQQPWKSAEQFIAKSRDPESNWTFRVALGDGIRPGCYHDTNLQMLEAADVLVVIHNGLATQSMGGTGEVLQLADEDHLKIPTVVLDPAQNSSVVRHDTWHPGEPAEELLAKINDDMASTEACSNPANSQRTGDSAVWAVHQSLDNVANNTGKTFRGSLELSTRLHFWATVVATATASFAEVIPWERGPVVLTVLELLLVGYAFGLFINCTKKKANPRWRRSRLAAEISDSQIQTAELVDPLQPLVVRHNEDWKRFALSVALDAHRQKEMLLADKDVELRRVELTGRYLENRIVGQLNYFRKQTRKSIEKLHRWHLIAKFAFYLAMPVVAIALIIKWRALGANDHDHDSGWVKSVFMYALPSNIIPPVGLFVAWL